jgi:6-phosphofructokinase
MGAPDAIVHGRYYVIYTLFFPSQPFSHPPTPTHPQTCNANQLDGLVLCGGERTHTVSAYLSEYLISQGCATKVVCVPVGTSGSFKNAFVETTVGFNSSTKVAGQIVGNNATDGASAKKYYYFMRLMGAKPSHSTLEVALLTHPNFVILAEEVKERNMTLADIVKSIADMVQARAAKGTSVCVISHHQSDFITRAWSSHPALLSTPPSRHHPLTSHPFFYPPTPPHP